MLLELLTKRLPLQKQIDFLKKNGLMLGVRFKHGRKIHIYLIREVLIEVVYEGDTPDGKAECINIQQGGTYWNKYEKKEKQKISKS